MSRLRPEVFAYRRQLSKGVDHSMVHREVNKFPTPVTLDLKQRANNEYQHVAIPITCYAQHYT